VSDYEDEPARGLRNQPWLIKAALYWVGQANLHYGICSMIDYFMDEDEPEVYTALDVLVQCALTGYYEETDDGQPIDRDDIEETVKRFQDILNGLPTTDESDRLNNAEDDSDNEEEK